MKSKKCASRNCIRNRPMPNFMLTAFAVVGWFIPATAVTAHDSPQDLLARSQRIVFLGDSITAEGSYVALFDA